MKKTLALLLALLMALGLVFAVGCSDGDDDDSSKIESSKTEPKAQVVDDDVELADIIEGKWETEIDFSDMFIEAFKDNEFGQYFDSDSVKLSAKLIFKFDDGDFSMKADADSLKDSIKGLREPFKKALNAYLEKQLEGSGVSVEEALAASNTTLDAMIDQVMEKSNDSIEESITDVEKSGVYKVEGNKIYVAEKGDDFEDYFECSVVSGKKFKIKKIVSEDVDEDNKFFSTLPWTLVKKK